MTTIVYDHKRKQVATDGRLSAGGQILKDDWNKAYLGNDGAMWFIAGAEKDIEKILSLQNGDKEDTGIIMNAIRVKGGVAKIVGIIDGKVYFAPLNYNEGCGSGESWALAALDFGKTAKEAIEYAITKDCYTGGKVRVFNLKGEEIE